MAKPLPISPLAPPSGFPTLPKIDGVRFASVAAGVKYTGRTDLMLAEIAPGSVLAGTFTRSATRAAPVLWCEANIAAASGGEQPFAVIVNSGNANAFTGGRGLAAVKTTTQGVADLLGTTPERVFPASTGVIGEPLPAERITAKLGELRDALASENAQPAANAIMTTDTFAKGAGATITIDGALINIAGFAKGSGMIEPDMGTMLVYIFTDARIDRGTLQAIVSDATIRTFNAITVDSDTSTSDTLIVAATNRAGPMLIPNTPAHTKFSQALESVMKNLAHQVVRDGEGATKFITVNITGAASEKSAKTIAKAIANSPLVKTAIAGEDPNWGRVVMAIGKAGEPANRDEISIHFGDILVAEQGWVHPDYREETGAEYMQNQEIEITCDLGIGTGSATVWTCDLTHQYITINADYRS